MLTGVYFCPNCTRDCDVPNVEENRGIHPVLKEGENPILSTSYVGRTGYKHVSVDTIYAVHLLDWVSLI